MIKKIVKLYKYRYCPKKRINKRIN